MVETFEKQVTEVEAVIRRLQQTFQCPIWLCLLRVLRPRNRAPCPICKESITKRSLQVLPHWNAIVGKVAQLGAAFQRDTGYELSAGGVEEGHGWTERRSMAGEVTRKAECSTEMGATVPDTNKRNSKASRKRKADEYVGTVIYIEDVSDEATRPSDVKSHINIRSAFPVSRRSRQRKTGDATDAVDSTTEHGATQRNRKQEVAVGNMSSSVEPSCVVDLTNTEIGDDQSKAKDVVVRRMNGDDDDADNVAVTNGGCDTRRSNPGKRSRRAVIAAKESELLACLAEAPLVGVSGNRAHNTRQLRNSVCSVERKERNLPAEIATTSKVTVRRTNDRMALPNRRRSGKGVENVNDEHIPLDRNLNCDDIREVCLNGSINEDNLTDNDKTPKVSSKVMCWLKTTTDSVSPLSEGAVVSQAMGNKMKASDGGGASVKGVSEQRKGVRTRDRGTRNSRVSSCVKSAVDVTETGEQTSLLLKDPGQLVEHVTSVHQTHIGNCELADDPAVRCLSPGKNVPETSQCVASDEIVPTLDASNVGKRADKESCDEGFASRCASNKRIFRCRLEEIHESRPGGATCANDPYLFVASPGTPLRKKRRTKQRSRTRNPIQKRCLNVVISKGACGRKSGDKLAKVVESNDEHELGELAEKISEAEEYDLLLSQQFRDMEQVARYEQSTDPASGSGDVDERQRPASRGQGGQRKVTGDPPKSRQIREVCVVDVHVAADKEDSETITASEPRLIRDRRGEAGRQPERERAKMQFRGPAVPTDYSRKGREVKTRARNEEDADKSTKETLIWSAAMKTAGDRPSGERMGKGRGKRSVRRRKEETSGTDDEENDAALIVRRNEQVEPSGDIAGNTEVDVEGGAASLSCVPESTLEAVTDSNQSQARSDSDNNGCRSTSAIKETRRRNSDLERDDIRCENDLDDRHDYRQMKELTCDVVESDRENDAVLLVPEMRDFEANVDGAILVIGSDEDELNCSNQTIGFEPMLDFELHVNAEVDCQMAPVEERAVELRPLESGSNPRSQAPERGSAFNARDAESQTAIDDPETVSRYVCHDMRRRYSSEGLKTLGKLTKNVEDLAKSPEIMEALSTSTKSVETMETPSKNAEALDNFPNNTYAPEKSPKNMEALAKSPKCMGNRRKPLENMEALDKWPENLETLEKTPKRMETLEKTPKRTETLEKTPKRTETLEKTPKRIETLEKTPKRIETLEKTPKRTETLEKTPKKMEPLEKTHMDMEIIENFPKNLEALDKSPKNIQTVDKSTMNLETVKKSPRNLETLENSPTNTETLEKYPRNSEALEKFPTHMEMLENPPMNVETLDKYPKRIKTPEKTRTNMETLGTSAKNVEVVAISPKNMEASETASPVSMHALDKSPGSMHSPDKSPGSMHSPDKSPGSMHALDKSPGSMHAPDKSPGSMHAPDKSPKKMETPQTSPKSLKAFDNSPMNMETLEKSPEKVKTTKESPKNEDGHFAALPTEERDIVALSGDEVSSLKSTRKTFSLDSTPLSKGPRDSLELHNVLWEAAEMMPDTDGSIDPDLLERNSERSSPIIQAKRKPSAKHDDSRNGPSSNNTGSTRSSIRKLSLKHSKASKSTSPKLPLDCVGSCGRACEKSPRDRDNTRVPRAIVSTNETQSTSSDIVSPTGKVGEQSREMVTRKLTLLTTKKPSGAGDSGWLSPCDCVEKSLSGFGKQKISGSVTREETGNSPRSDSGSNVANGIKLSDESKSVLTASVVFVKNIANPQVQPPEGSADNLQGDTTFLSSDEIVLGTADASDDISPLIKVPSAVAINGSKNVHKKPREKKASAVVRAEIASSEADVKNGGHVKTLQRNIMKETYHDDALETKRDCQEMESVKRGNTAGGENDIDTDEDDTIGNDVETDVDLRAIDRLGDSVVVATVSSKSNPSDESETCSSVLLSCIPPTLRDDAALEQRVNDVHGDVETNGTQRVNMVHVDGDPRNGMEMVNGIHRVDMRNGMQHIDGRVKYTEYDTGQSSLGLASEASGKYSDADEFMEEDFAPDFKVGEIIATAEDETGGVMSSENGGKFSEISHEDLGREVKEDINRSPSNAAHETSVVYDKSPILGSSSATKCDSAPRRRICARRSLWSQSSGVSRGESTVSTPLIPLVERRSGDYVTVDDTARGIVEKGRRRIVSAVRLDSQDVDLDSGAGEGEGRETGERWNTTVGCRERGLASSGGSLAERRVAISNEADIRFSQMSTVDGDESSQSGEDSDLPDLEPDEKSGFGSDADFRRGSDVVNLSSGSFKGQRRSCVRDVRGLASRRSSIPSEIQDSMNDGSVVQVRDDDNDIVRSQNRSRSGISGYHDDLPDDVEQASCHDDSNTPDGSDDEGDVSSELEACCDEVTYIGSEESRCDTDDFGEEENSDASDVDGLVLPTPQKRKPILQVAVGLHGDVVDSSDDDESELSSPEGVDACGSAKGKFGDDAAKKGTRNGDIVDVILHTRLTVDGSSPTDSTKRTPGKLPVSPARSLPVTPGNVSTREEWERVHTNIDNDMSFGNVGHVTGDDKKKGIVVKTEAVTVTDSDEDEELVIRKRRKRKRRSVVELDSDEAEAEDTPGGSTCHHSNVTSSSGLSSQSELPITQCKQKLQTEVDYLQDQILQMEAAIAADEGGNHGNPPAGGSHGETVGTADRSETVRCSPATSSGSKRRLLCRKLLSCATGESLINRKTSPIHRTSSGQSSHHARSRGDEFVTYVDSDSCGDELETSAVEFGNVDEGHSHGGVGVQKRDTLSRSRLLPDGDPGCHSNGAGREDEESPQSCGGGADEVEDLDSEERSDGEMEEGSVEGGDSGVDSDKDLFDMSQDKSCIPQTLSQDDDDIRKPCYLPPLLTSTPRPSFDHSSLPPSREIQTVADDAELSTAHGDDKLNYLEDEDILPSLDEPGDVEDQRRIGNSPVKTSNNAFDTSVNNADSMKTRLVPSNSGVNKLGMDTGRRGGCRTSPNRTETAQMDKTLIGADVNGMCSADRARNSGVSVVRKNEQRSCRVGDDGNGWRSVDVKRNGDGYCGVREIAVGTSKSMATTRQKYSPCPGVTQIGRKANGYASPLVTAVASPHGRCRNQIPTPSVAITSEDADFPRRPSWVFIASGISKFDHQPSIDRLVRLLGCRFVARYSPAVTHVLVNPVPPGGLRCPRTLKYFQGVAGGKWVVSVQWVLDSLTARSLRPVADYEISSDTGSDGTHNAPSRARRSIVPLLHEYEICCHGSFKDLTREDICGLAEACGAMTIQESSMFTFDPSKVQVIIVENNAASNMAELQKFRRRYGVALAQKEWLLDSISVYDIQPLEDYAIDGSTTK